MHSFWHTPTFIYLLDLFGSRSLKLKTIAVHSSSSWAMAAASSFDPALYKCCRCDKAMVNLVPMVLWDYKPYARGFDQIGENSW